MGKILIHTYPLIEFAKYYKVSIDWLCGKIKDSKNQIIESFLFKKIGLLILIKNKVVKTLPNS